jgi:hypothetical protein
MRSEDLYRSMSGIDDALLIECLQPTMKRRRMPIRTLAALAACLVFVLGGAIFEPWQRFGSDVSGNGNHGVESSNNPVEASQKAKSNFFVITANAAELPNDGECVSGEVFGIRFNDYTGGLYGGYIPELFSIGGRNIAKVKITTDKNEIFTSKSVYEGDSDYPTDDELAICNANPYSGKGYYNWVSDVSYKKYHYDYWQVQGNSVEMDYNANLSYGFFAKDSINLEIGDMKMNYRACVDMLEGTRLSVAVTYENGQREEHHYLVHSGKVLYEYNMEKHQCERYERFLTPDEERDGTLWTYSILIEQLD